ncbi:MAG: EAL domain-containing protein, partial [Gammaproteobacteria bacterium]|nr:EAL domain-containing protein [Gammaproteobacteria bacterium]
WRHPERGLVPAQHFIALAEECGLIVRLGEMALHLACHQLDVLRRAGFTDLRMAVNLSPRQIAEPRFLSRLQEILNDTRVDPGMLDLELSPAILSGPEEPLQGLLMTLRSLGVHLVLDDFGAGPTSLVGLQSLPLAAVKIDQRFIRDIPYDPGATDVTSAVIALAQCLRLKVIAEGVETPEQVDFLIAQRCTQAQGNLFCQGLDGDALMAFLERHRARA